MENQLIIKDIRMEHSSVEQTFKFEVFEENNDWYCAGRGSYMEIVFDRDLQMIQHYKVPQHWQYQLARLFEDHIYMGTIVDGKKTLELQIFEILEKEGCTEIEFGRTNTWFGEYAFNFWHRNHFLRITTFRGWEGITDLRLGLYVTNEKELPLIKSWLDKFEVRAEGKPPFKVQHRWMSSAQADLYN